MQDNDVTTNRGGDGPIHWPTVADPMLLLDQLERRLDHCETAVSEQLAQIQRRLERLETEVTGLQSRLTESQMTHEKQVVELAQRLTRLETG